MASSRQQRATKDGPARLARWAIFFFTVGVAAYLFLHSPLFALQAVEVVGANLVSEAEVVRLAGLREGDNLLRLPTERIRRRLVDDPRIGAARLRRMPPGRLVVEIEERVPVALVPYADGFLFIDAAGRLLAADRRSRPGLPVITGAPLERVGLHLPPPEPLVVGAEVASRMSPGLRAAVAEINVSDPNDMVLFTLQGLPILLGDGADLPRKLLVAESLLERAAAERAGALDVRVPSTPTLRNP